MSSRFKNYNAYNYTNIKKKNQLQGWKMNETERRESTYSTPQKILA